MLIGEIAARAVISGLQGVPTIFLSGDDKAALEACLFVPDIETAVVKQGLGIEWINDRTVRISSDDIRDLPL